MEENNNNTSNSYTGEYGNPVEGTSPPDSSTYSYSYKEGDNSVTHSGDYYPDNDSPRDNKEQTPVQDSSYQNNSITCGHSVQVREVMI